MRKEDLPKLDVEKTGRIIKSYMKKNQWDAFDLATVLGMKSVSTIYAWTQGRHAPNAEYILQLANIFGCSMEDLIGVEGKEIENEWI